MIFVGDSSFCIKPGVFEGYGYYLKLLTLALGAAVSSKPTISLLLPLGIAITRNAGRILMHNTA
jgi:hypothetical protein